MPSVPSTGLPIDIVKAIKSSSIISAIAVLAVAFIVPTLGGLISAITVSFISTSESSVITTVIIAVLSPSAIENVVTSV